MSIYSEINQFIQYFTQLRKLENYLVFDVSFPQTWKIQKKYVIEDKFVNNGVHEGQLHLSFVCEYDEENINLSKDDFTTVLKEYRNIKKNESNSFIYIHDKDKIFINWNEIIDDGDPTDGNI